MKNIFLQSPKRVIILLIVLIIFIFFSVFVYEKLKNIDKQTTFIDKKVTAKEKFLQKRKKQADEIIEKNKQFIENQKNEATRKDFIMAKHYKLESGDCEKIIDEKLREDCYNYIKIENIATKKDFSLCNTLGQEWQDICIYMISVGKMKNWEDCLLISDNLIHDMCLKKFSIQFNDLKICDILHQGKQGCIDRTKAVNNNWGGDIQNCKDIKKTEYFLMCVSMSNDDCGKLNDEYLIKRCESLINYGPILADGSKEDCTMLPLEEYRRTCEMYFDNNRKHIDFDGDGVDNGMELFCDTNPLIAEEEAVEHFQHEDRWSQVFENIYYTTFNKLQDLTIDTDNDGLRDYEEKVIYKTNFEDPDTDNDGYLDGEEAKRGHNPRGE